MDLYAQSRNSYPMRMGNVRNFSAIGNNNKDSYFVKYYDYQNNNGYNGYNQQSKSDIQRCNDDIKRCNDDKNNILSIMQRLKNEHHNTVMMLNSKNRRLRNDSNKNFNYNFIFIVIILVLAFVVYYLYSKDNYIDLKSLLSN